MLFRLIFLAIIAVLAALPLQSQAIAMGEVTVRSALGQLLDADIDVTMLSAQEAESLTARLAPPDMFTEAGLEYGVLARSLRLTIEKKSDRPVIHISSDKVITEPYLMLLIEVSAGGNRSVRQYALLLDPAPLQNDAQAVASELALPKIAPVPPSAHSPLPSSSAPPKKSAVSKRERNASDTQNAATSSEQSRATHHVKSGETLHQIATSMQSRGTTLAQVMIAIVQENPEAFDQRNAHRMKAGVVLKLPDAALIQSIDPKLAYQQLQSQTREFNQASSQVKNAALPSDQKTEVADSVSANRSRSGRIRQQPSEKTPVAPQKDQLKLSSPTSPESQINSQDNSALDTLANQKSLAESTQRITELEKNIRDLQDQLAIRHPTSDAPQPQDSQPQTTATQPATLSSDKLPAPSATVSPLPQLKTASVKPVVVPVTTDFFSEIEKLINIENFLNSWSIDPQIAVGAAGAASVLGLLFLIRAQRRKRRRSAQSVRREPVTDEASVFGQAGGRHVDTNHSVFHSNFVPSVSQLDAKEVEPIAEADVYIAYGRDEQAEEILLDALKSYPQRHGLHVKLLEIYATRKDVKKFAHLAAELRLFTHGLGAEWRQAAQLGQKLEPENSLYFTSPPAKNVNDRLYDLSAATSAASHASHTTHTANQAAQMNLNVDNNAANKVENIATNKGDNTAANTATNKTAAAVTDFSISLDGMLQEGRAPIGEAHNSSSATSAEIIDFTHTGVTSRLAVTPAEAVTLKTKIDLALACNDIGDSVGARDLLAEVASSRHPELAARAKSLLQQLA